MNRKLLQQLIIASYTKKGLDQKKVLKIASLLRTKDVKAYIRGLKLSEKKRTVYIAMPSKGVYNTSRKQLQEVFANKELIFHEDPSLLLGAQVLDNDMMYEMSLKNRLDDIVSEVEQHYNE